MANFVPLPRRKSFTARTRVRLSTGLPGLDEILRGLMPGDNLVWQVDSVDDYLPFAQPLCRYARENDQRCVYFRFGMHRPLLTAADGAEIRQLHPDAGFEPFLAEIHNVINLTGRGGLFIFDCLSDLAADWCSDRMVGNFFMLTCPYLYDRANIAYFAILRNYHSFHAGRPISNTTQILIDVHRRQGKLYVHPLKVQHRHSPTMYMLHAWEEDEFRPVTQSCVITDILAGAPWSRLDSASANLGFWTKAFDEAEGVQRALEGGADRQEETTRYFHKLLHMLISRHEQVLRLAKKHFTLKDLLEVRRRMIGTGLIGGKSVGMLLARAILRRHDRRWEELLEPHDSFYVGADVFYTYLVQNGCWWMVQKQKGDPAPSDESETGRRRILSGEFPEYIVKQFADMLDYFGQSPIIVRSSSLLEDNFGNAFAGKYESVFCANQGGRDKRLEDFLFAVRTVYASTMGEDALHYRANRGLMGHDEQMALLIQRVSGVQYGRYFYPQAAGVGFSFNPYVWHESIDPEAGMLRLVFGVGTRAVDRADDDYTRVVALNAPARRPEANLDEVREYAQRRVDVLDLETNQLCSSGFEEVVRRSPGLPIAMFAARDAELEARMARERRTDFFPWVLTFDQLLNETGFVKDMREMLAVLEAAYECPVDTEFTFNLFDETRYKINLLQCRPLQVAGGVGAVSEPPAQIPAGDLILASQGTVIGKSVCLDLDWLVYVVPSRYGALPAGDRYAVARLIGELLHHDQLAGSAVMLLGPGRWGTTTPSLGVPVSFTDINTVAVLCEIVEMNESLIPDVSLGTHFFNELVENNILYLALFPNREGMSLNRDFLEREAPNRFAELVPDHGDWAQAVRAIAVRDLPGGDRIILNANTLGQRVVCYRRRP